MENPKTEKTINCYFGDFEHRSPNIQVLWKPQENQWIEHNKKIHLLNFVDDIKRLAYLKDRPTAVDLKEVYWYPREEEIVALLYEFGLHTSRYTRDGLCFCDIHRPGHETPIRLWSKGSQCPHHAAVAVTDSMVKKYNGLDAEITSKFTRLSERGLKRFVEKRQIG